jgi:hypothetical protein
MCLKCKIPVTDQHTKHSAVYAIHIECLLDDIVEGGR